ncbi:amidohydrolase family protein [candidate division KSB1 bacterium]|nr:amidohydrolase family protein [candidate division KSB1 bacterium]MBL7094948.1 amidohydrolase family protein [candidate division KSB1 bacterium]
MKKIDAHVHIKQNGPEFLDQAKADNFFVIPIIVDHNNVPWYKNFLQSQRQHHPEQFSYVTTFHIDGWDEPGWQEKTLEHIKSEFENGAIGVKVWKNIGMEFRDKDSNFVMIDDPKFDPIFDFIEYQNKTLSGHIGEPRDCWLPLEEMLASSNKRYYSSHPKYHMYKHPEYPSYEDQINSYARMLEKHPNLRYVGCHLASIEWSMKKLAKMLDRFPNMAVDLAARLDDIQIQDTDEVRDFFGKYQNRVLYGTDLEIEEHDNPKDFAKRMHEKWQTDWTYFSTDSAITIKGIDKPVIGLNLPQKILKKIYWENARKWYRCF